MKCLKCNNQIDTDLSNCPNCGAEIKPSGQWVQVYTINNEINAQFYKAVLEENGIPVNILSQYDSTRMLTVGSLAIIKIFVPLEYSEEAIDIIAELDKDQSDEN